MRPLAIIAVAFTTACTGGTPGATPAPPPSPSMTASPSPSVSPSPPALPTDHPGPPSTAWRDGGCAEGTILVRLRPDLMCIARDGTAGRAIRSTKPSLRLLAISPSGVLAGVKSVEPKERKVKSEVWVSTPEAPDAFALVHRFSSWVETPSRLRWSTDGKTLAVMTKTLIRTGAAGRARHALYAFRGGSFEKLEAWGASCCYEDRTIGPIDSSHIVTYVYVADGPGSFHGLVRTDIRSGSSQDLDVDLSDHAGYDGSPTGPMFAADARSMLVTSDGARALSLVQLPSLEQRVVVRLSEPRTFGIGSLGPDGSWAIINVFGGQRPDGIRAKKPWPMKVDVETGELHRLRPLRRGRWFFTPSPDGYSVFCRKWHNGRFKKYGVLDVRTEKFSRWPTAYHDIVGWI